MCTFSVIFLCMKLYSIPVHVAKYLFLTAFSKVDLTVLKHDACRKMVGSCFVIFSIDHFKHMLLCIGHIFFMLVLMALPQSFKSIIG